MAELTIEQTGAESTDAEHREQRRSRRHLFYAAELEIKRSKTEKEERGGLIMNRG